MHNGHTCAITRSINIITCILLLLLLFVNQHHALEIIFPPALAGQTHLSVSLTKQQPYFLYTSELIYTDHTFCEPPHTSDLIKYLNKTLLVHRNGCRKNTKFKQLQQLKGILKGVVVESFGLLPGFDWHTRPIKQKDIDGIWAVSVGRNSFEQLKDMVEEHKVVMVKVSPDPNPWEVLFDSAPAVVFQVVFSFLFTLVTVRAAYFFVLFFRMNRAKQYAAGRKHYLDVASTVLLFQVLANLIMTVYNAVDPFYMRGILHSVPDSLMISSALQCVQTSAIVYQFYWAKLLKRLALGITLSFWMRHDVMRKVLLSVLALTIFFNLCVIALTIAPYNDLIYTYLVLPYTVTSVSLLGGIVVNGIRIYRIVSRAKTITVDEVRQITLRMVLSAVGLLITMLLFFLSFIVSFSSVWSYYVFCVFGQIFFLLASLSQVASFVPPPIKERRQKLREALHSLSTAHFPAFAHRHEDIVQSYVHPFRDSPKLPDPLPDPPPDLQSTPAVVDLAKQLIRENSARLQEVENQHERGEHSHRGKDDVFNRNGELGVELE